MNKVSPCDEFNGYRIKMKPNNNTTHWKLLCDCIQKMKDLTFDRMLIFYVRQGIIRDKDHDLFFFKANKVARRISKLQNSKTT